MALFKCLPKGGAYPARSLRKLPEKEELRNSTTERRLVLISLIYLRAGGHESSKSGLPIPLIQINGHNLKRANFSIDYANL